jgi:hypothetical protein
MQYYRSLDTQTKQQLRDLAGNGFLRPLLFEYEQTLRKTSHARTRWAMPEPVCACFRIVFDVNNSQLRQSCKSNRQTHRLAILG